MNDQPSKKIIFNKSTLWNLKAELLKKQEEVIEKKQQPQNKVENFKPLPAKSSSTNEDKVKISFKDKLKQVDVEELEACRKSKAALEKKSELYDHLSDSAGNSQLAGHFLVDFNTKKQQEAEREPTPPPPPLVVAEADQDDDDEWIEFTDCLGRTRKCLKVDLELYMEKDENLMKVLTKDLPKQNADGGQHTEGATAEKPFLVQKTNDYLQSLRKKWEEKEKELLDKDRDVHYQDLLFDEARMHGVAYYSFSTKEEERQKQMEDLKKRRAETLRAQKLAEEERKKRDDLMASRVAAARARMRARAGLPPEEPQDNTKDFTKCLLEFLNQQKDEAEAKAKEAEKKIREEKEIERQKFREAYVRDWDIGKQGVEDKVKPFKEMTQEEYVEQQRAKRIDEFAPPQASTSHRSNYAFDSRGRKSDSETKTKTWDDVRPRPHTPPPPCIGDLTERKGLYFSTQNISDSDMKYKNFVKPREPIVPTPIENELLKDVVDKTKSDKIKSTNSAQIEPPPTYDYYGPVTKRSKTDKPFSSDVREAYAQGAKSLEPKVSNRKLPKHYDFTFD